MFTETWELKTKKNYDARTLGTVPIYLRAVLVNLTEK